MGIIPFLALAKSALAPAVIGAAPVLVVAAGGFAAVAIHDPAGDWTRVLAQQPDTVAECMTRNVAALKSRLVLVGQPLYGTDVYGLTLKRGVTGGPIMSVVLQATDVGSTAVFTPIDPPQQPPEMIEKMLAGC